MEKKEKDNLVYLSDQELFLTKETDLLGTFIYVEQLQEMIKQCIDTDYTETIGLIGDWGNGKSSIVKTLEQKINGTKLNNKEIKFICYNAWKYNKDSFRKQFLINAIECKKTKQDVIKELYYEVSTIHVNLNEKIKKYLPIFLMILFICLILFLFMYYSAQLTNITEKEFLKTISDLVYKLSGFGTVTIITTSIFKNILIEENISEIKIFSPDRFYEIFKDNVCKNNKYLIFIIDDLDRCDPTQTIEILDTIKSYLKSNKGNYMFIIPIDKNRLYEILKKQKDYTYIECEDYFSKIFDLSLIIKKPGKTNLYEMIEVNSKNVGLSFSKHTMSLMADFLVETPRDVKTHLNNLKNMLITYKKQIKANYISVNESLNILDEIVKIYIIDKKWPTIFKFISEKFLKINVNDINSYNKKLFSDEELDSFELYLKRASIVSADYLPSYLYLKEDGISIDQKVVNAILILDEKMLDKSILDGTFINTFDYTYKRHIQEMNLYTTYFESVLNSYFYGLCKENTVTGSFLSKITLENIEEDIRKFRELNVNVIKIDNYKYIFEYIKNNASNRKYLGIFQQIIELLYSSGYYDESLKMQTYVKEYLSKKDVSNKLLNIQSNDFSDYVSYGQLTINLSESDIDKIIAKKIEEKDLKLVYTILNYNKFLCTKYGDKIMNLLSIYSKLGSSYSNWSNEKAEKDILELSILNILLENGDSSLVDKMKTKIIFGYTQYIVGYINSNIQNELLKSKLFDQLIKYCKNVDEVFNRKDVLSVLTNSFNIDKNKNELIKVLSLNLDDENKNDLYTMVLSKTEFKVGLERYIDFLNEINNSEFLDCWITLLKNKQSTTVRMKHIVNPQSISLNYNLFYLNLFPKLLSLNITLSSLIFENSTFEQLHDSQICWDFIKTLKPMDSRNNIIISKIKTFKNYLDAINVIKKKSHSKQYQNSMKYIVENVKNVDELIYIHGFLNNTHVLNSNDYEIIKEKVSRSFPHATDSFTNISWGPKQNL